MKNIVDWHSHILPGMDDGSKDVQESLLMLESLKEQGVDCVVATPHFYANKESLESFIERRNKCYSDLCKEMAQEEVKILCGAEVSYYQGISRMQNLEELRIANTNLILLEMPFAKWSDNVVRDLIQLVCERDLTIILAHIERYLFLQSKDVVRKLYENGVLMQVNASFFEGFTKKHKALKLLNNGKIDFIGSDCHNMTTRPPKIAKAYNEIKKRFGQDFVVQMCDYSHRMLDDSQLKNIAKT